MSLVRYVCAFLPCIWAIWIKTVFGVHDLEPISDASFAVSFTETQADEGEENEEQKSYCRGQKYQWQHQMALKCQKKFGPQSKWGFEKSYCMKAFQECRTARYVQCCTKPVGPEKLEEYCDLPRGKSDPACLVKLPLVEIKATVKLYVEQLDKVANFEQLPATSTSTSTSTSTVTTTTATTTDDDDGDGPAPVPASIAAQEPAPAPGPLPAPMMAPAPGPLAAPMYAPGPAPGPAPEPLNPCTVLMQMTNGIIRDLDEMKAVRDDVHGDRTRSLDPDLTSAINGVLNSWGFLDQTREFPPCRTIEKCADAPQDVEVTFLQTSNVDYTYKADEDESTDYSDRDEDCWEDIEKNLTEIQFIMDHVEEANDALHDLETNVHPHGLKWWRYMYEYSAVEGLIFAAQVPLIIGVQSSLRFLETLAREGKRVTRKSYEAHSIHKYSFQSFLYQGTAITSLVFVYWFLSYNHFFDWLASPYDDKMRMIFPQSAAFLALRSNTSTFMAIDPELPSVPVPQTEDPEVVQQKMTDIHLPLMGNSYFLTCIDVTMHTFFAFFLYELMMWAVIHKFVRRIMLWRRFDSDEEQLLSPRSTKIATGWLELIWRRKDYKALERAFIRRVEGMEEYHQAKQILKEMEDKAKDEKSGVKSQKLAQQGVDLDFKHFEFHRYLTLHVRDGTQALVEISLGTWLSIVLFSLFGVPFCLFFMIDFVALLLPMLIIFTIAFLLIYWESRRILLKKLEDGQEDKPVAKHRQDAFHFRGQDIFFSVRKFCHFLQFCFMFICYSFARVMTSYYMWVDETTTATIVTVSFIVFYAVIMAIGGDVVTIAVVCLAIPPYILPEAIARNFQTLQEEGFKVKEDTEHFRMRMK